MGRGLREQIDQNNITTYDPLWAQKEVDKILYESMIDRYKEQFLDATVDRIKLPSDIIKQLNDYT